MVTMEWSDDRALDRTSADRALWHGAVDAVRTGLWSQMRGLLSRFSDWVVAHPLLWGVGVAVVLVVLGVALDLAPIVVIAVGAAIGVLNILHARRRGYCPIPADPQSRPVRADADDPFLGRGGD
jgi:hypothetical protein